jgi:inorganic pyrophosphatase
MIASTAEVLLISISCALAILWGIFNIIHITRIQVETETGARDEALLETNRVLFDISEKIRRGARSFLIQEYSILAIFVLVFSGVVWFLVDYIGSPHFRAYTFVCYLIGSFTSMFCGAVGMAIAVASNYRTTLRAKHSLNAAFNVAYRGGSVMGFLSVGVSLGVLLAIIVVSSHIFEPTFDIKKETSVAVLMEFVAGYGLGGSSVALFARVGGGIYTKAADVGADLVGKLEAGLEEDSPKNPATIADNVGDNVGDVAGMGADLFGSFAESTCASLILLSLVPKLVSEPGFILFPLVISAVGLLACLATSIYGIYIAKVKEEKDIEIHLRDQLIISTLLILIGLFFATKYLLPDEWMIDDKHRGYWYYVFICTGLGLLSGLLIGFSTEYYTSKQNSPVKEMAQSCTSGSALNIIYGLALGYMSCLIPIFLLGLTILVSLKLLGLLGASLAAIGMLSNLAIGLAIDVFGPISDNAGGISEMSGQGPEIRKMTDALDSAGNTTAAIGKGFAIGSAALVSLALYGAFVLRAKSTKNNVIVHVEITDPWIFCSLLYGALVPFIFSALTMKSVGKAAQEMVAEVREQLKDERIRNQEIEPDYERCVKVSTVASLKEMILPAMLVIFTPIVFGIFFHPLLVAGLLPGALLTGVHLAISMSNTGGAWDNTKKLIESGSFVTADGRILDKASKERDAAVVGDTIGDPMKDTSGPSLNIVVKLMAIISLVFAGAFSRTSLLAGWLDIHQ